ncbi:response regulator [Rubritalea marina]|uniref:response regulator n=1 Tax=Rubritalea marina TaxID=361055 RepID=UPI0003802D84|nr:response regulator [Rubritalea marina]
MSEEVNKWQKRYEREKNSRIQAEALLEEKSSQLFEANSKLEEQVVVQSSKLSIEEKKFTALFHSSVDGILLYTLSGEILDANPSICKLLQKEASVLIGDNLFNYFPDGSQELANKAKHQMKQLGHSRFEVEMICADASLVPTEITSSKFDVGGETIVQGIIRDITERKQIERDLEEASTAAIKANKTKSLFLATMSHEIRTPLNGILGFTDILLDSEPNDEQRQHLQLIKRSGDILLAIINDILDFSRAESMQIELEMVDYNLTDCIEETLEIHAQTAAAKDVGLLYHIDDDVPQDLNGDIGRIKQVALNLVSNALKFTSEGNVIVRVSNHDTGFFKIEVEDSGIGFKPEIAEQLFKPFIQADASTTRKYGGTGLGLAICKQLMECMGGSISARSVLGEGATFTVILPIIHAQAPVERNFDQTDLSKMEGLRVLAIDDYPINLEFLKARLSKWGCIVTTMASSTHASSISATSLAEYDLILSDMLMPEMDGIMLARKFKEMLGVNTPPMILITSSRYSSEKTEAKKAGYKSVIYKPARERELVRHINAALTTEIPMMNTQRVTVSAKKKSQAYVLIVEDNPINAKLAKLLVERMGLVAHIAHNGEEALAALKNNDVYTAILMDMQMPVMDGLIASTKIREGAGGPLYVKVPIIAMTANALAEDKQRCLDAGMDYYLTKPINVKELTKLLTQLKII